ncbi:MAG: hypothetical protein ACO25P_09255 [Ilumatobacteraceae bacterium]
MVAVLVGVLVLCSLVMLGVAASRRTPASDDSVDDFRRHLNALSPDARRAIIERPIPLTGIDDEQERDSEDSHGA